MHTLVLFFLAQMGTTTAFPGMRSSSSNYKTHDSTRWSVMGAGPGLETRSTASTTFPPWKAPQPGEVRSPCPGLNSAANHNICPRSGKSYTIPILISCLEEAYNVAPDFSTLIGATGFASNPNPLQLQFDLDQLDAHEKVIEHDASLSRADASTGDNHTFNQTIFDTVLAYYSGMTDATIPVAAKAKYNRVTTEAARDPQFTYGPVQFVLSYGETALYLSVMGDPITGIAPVEYVKIWFEEERLPYAEGWRKPTTQTSLATLGQMVLELNAANGEVLPEGLILGASSLKAVYSGLDPVTGGVVDPVVQTLRKLLGLT